MSILNHDVPPTADGDELSGSTPGAARHDRAASAHVGWTFGAEVFDALPSPMALVAPSGIVTEVNTAWCRLTGEHADTDVGRPLWQRFSPAERAHLAALVERYAHAAGPDTRPTVAGTELRHADGRRLDVALRLGATTDDRAPRILLAQLEPLASDDREAAVRQPGTGDRQIALASIARAVASGGDLDRCAGTVLAAVARTTGCPLVGLWRRAARREALVLADGIGFPASARGRLVLDTDPDGLAGHTLRSRSVVVIGGPSGTHAQLPHVLRDRGVVTGAAVGLYGPAGADGVLTLGAPHNRHLPDDAVRFLSIVGDLVSMALQREAVDDLINGERQRTTQTARELELLRRRWELAHDVADLLDWRWAAPAPVEVDRRLWPPPRLSLQACLDGGPQALVDTAVDDDVEALAEALNTCLRLQAELDCTLRLHTTDGVQRVRLRGAVDRDRQGIVREISGVAMSSPVEEPVTDRSDDGSAPSDDQGPGAHAAHDLNNLLTAILGTAEQLLADGEDRHRLTAIVRAGRRAHALVAGLQPGHDEEHPLAGAYELADVVDQVRPLLPGLVGTSIDLVYELGRGARTSQPPRHALERVLLNLVSNSRDAIDGAGTIRIAVDTCIQLDEHDAPSAPPVGSWARLTVTDDGAGMAPADQERAFDPGYTTRTVGRHQGLGLASVRETVAAVGGVICVDSVVGRGTTIEIHLPLAARAAARLQPLRPPPLPAGPPAPTSEPAAADDPDRRVALLVDDEPSVRTLVADLLARLGFTVHIAAGGAGALALARDLDHVDLVVSDLRMPDIDGLMLARRLRTIHRHTAIVLLTGAPPSAPIADRKLRVVRKPFDWEALRDAVRSLMPPPAELEPSYPAANG